MPAMARLILLNGPPGIGKSTLAQRFVDDHPLALALDIDVIRSLLGRWDEHEAQSGPLARALALEMARVHLVAGHDVIVPQLLARAPFIEAMEELAGDVGATFHEIVLVTTREDAVGRFDARSRERARTGQPDPHREIVERDGGRAALEAHVDDLAALVETRQRAVQITTTWGAADEAYGELLRAVAREQG